MFHVVLVEPEIPPNTGNIARLCLAAGARLHLVGPLGFSLDEKSLKRAGLDYWDEVDRREWASLDELQSSAGDGARFFYYSAKAKRAYWEERFQDGDHLVFGPETRGLPRGLLAAHAERCLAIPQRGGRSLNLATAAGIALYEALRQQAMGRDGLPGDTARGPLTP